jgi:hypothetical protein
MRRLAQLARSAFLDQRHNRRPEELERLFEKRLVEALGA